MYKQKFITGSNYVGPTPDMLGLHGFGKYTFPDGSQYSGYFRYGHFNGRGSLTLAAPYNFIFRGIWDEGKLKHVEEMVFDDGLRIAGTFDGNTLNTDNWIYCSPKDRRFLSELFYGMNGIFAKATARQRMRHVPYGCYDTEEGIYAPFGRFISRIPAPFPQQRFVGCDKEHAWIIENCRRGTEVIYLDDMPVDKMNTYTREDIETRRALINSNLKAMATSDETRRDCQCNMEAAKRLFAANINKAERKTNESSECDKVGHSPEVSSVVPVTPSSISCVESFSQESVKDIKLINKIKEGVGDLPAKVEEEEDVAQTLLDLSRIFRFLRVYRAE